MGRTSDARERLVDEAARLFHARSYEGVGVQELCEAAEINKGSFYHFFASKEDLLLAVIDAQWEATCTLVLDPGLKGDLPPLARIERVFTIMAREQRSAKRAGGLTPGCPLANLAGEVSSHAPKLRKRLARVYEEMQSRFAETLREARDSKEIPKHSDVDRKAEAIVALAEGGMLLAVVHDDAATTARLSDLALALARA